MATNNDRWEQKISAAVEEIESRERYSASGGGFSLPSWTPYVASLILGFQIARFAVSDGLTHEPPSARDYTDGGRVALLMVAEDIEAHRNRTGKLPATPNNPLAQALGMEYEVVEGDRFKLSIIENGKKLSFEEGRDRIKITN